MDLIARRVEALDDETRDLLDAMGEQGRSREALDRSRTLFGLLLGDADGKERNAGSESEVEQP